jgi:hypothetical protein
VFITSSSYFSFAGAVSASIAMLFLFVTSTSIAVVPLSSIFPVTVFQEPPLTPSIPSTALLTGTWEELCCYAKSPRRGRESSERCLLLLFLLYIHRVITPADVRIIISREFDVFWHKKYFLLLTLTC